jgi:hypothetical protein
MAPPLAVSLMAPNPFGAKTEWYVRPMKRNVAVIYE